MTELGRWVCVVDDDDDIREVVVLVLEASGRRVRAAADGEQALAMLREHTGCCLVILDLMMPGMNGWQFRAAQRADARLAAIPVVVLTGVREVSTQTAGLEVAASLQKPVDLDALMSTVARHCA